MKFDPLYLIAIVSIIANVVLVILFVHSRRSYSKLMSKCLKEEQRKEALMNDLVYDASVLLDEHDKVVLKSLRQCFEEEKVYLNPDLSIQELARLVGTNKSRLSHADKYFFVSSCWGWLKTSSALPSSMISPKYINTTWSAMRSACRKVCVTMMMEYCSLSCTNKSSMVLAEMGSKALVASSARMYSGSTANERARQSRCCCPMESREAGVRIRPRISSQRPTAFRFFCT